MNNENLVAVYGIYKIYRIGNKGMFFYKIHGSKSSLFETKKDLLKEIKESE